MINYTGIDEDLVSLIMNIFHCDIIKWQYFPRYWPFVCGIHQSPVNSHHKGQWCGAVMFSSAWTNSWANNGDASDLRRHCTHYDATVMFVLISRLQPLKSLKMFPHILCPQLGRCQITHIYHQISNIRHTKSQNFNVSSLVLQLSLPNDPNPLKPGVKSGTKM